MSAPHHSLFWLCQCSSHTHLSVPQPVNSFFFFCCFTFAYCYLLHSHPLVLCPHPHLLHIMSTPLPVPLPTALMSRLSCTVLDAPPLSLLAPAPVKRTTGGMGKSWELAPCSDYQFCQYVSPSLAHDTGPCSCMLSPSPFGPFR